MKYFSPETDPALFKCPCGTCEVKPTVRLLDVLDACREEAGVPFVINSGPRCWHHNKLIGGAEYSEHVDGEAADVRCRNSKDRYKILQAAHKMGVSRIGVAKGFIHLGVSDTHTPYVVWVYE